MQEMATTIKAWTGDNDQLHQEKQQENVWATILHHRMMMPNQQMHCLVCCKRFCLKALQVNERVKPVLLLRRAVRVSKAVHRCEILKMRGVEWQRRRRLCFSVVGKLRVFSFFLFFFKCREYNARGLF